MTTRDTLLITGAAGHMGSLLMRGLNNSFPLIGVDQKPSEDPQVLQGDIGNMDALGVDGHKVSVALHFAANPDEEQPMSNLAAANLLACEAFLRWCAEQGIPRIVFASSCEAFLGTDSESSLPLEAPFAPRNVYGCTKVFGEMLCRMLSRTHGCHTLSLRLGAMLPETLHQELAGNPAYEAIRLPEEEFLATIEKILATPWTGHHAVFLGNPTSKRLPTTQSLELFFQQAISD